MLYIGMKNLVIKIIFKNNEIIGKSEICEFRKSLKKTHIEIPTILSVCNFNKNVICGCQVF